MAKMMEAFKCDLCGNIVETVHAGAGQLSCCGQHMTSLKENSTDAAQEKHVPVVEKTNDGYLVKVGSVNHPMDDNHYIEFIELIAGNTVYRKNLAPGDSPEASFATTASSQVSARAYCNLHGMWRA